MIQLIEQPHIIKRALTPFPAFSRNARDRRGLAWAYAHLATVCGHLSEAAGLRSVSTERAYVQDVVEKQYRYALIGRSWGERAIADPMPYALASVQASQALVLLVKLGFEREATRESRLREAVRLAEDGAARLATTRRAPTAATAQMTKAEALLLLAEMPSIKEPDLLRAEAIGALGDSVALLARGRSLEINELREEYDELWHHLSRVRKRYSLII